ncbi:SpvB/TcaC N-terminal domain-containing protein, partial [Haloferula sargassicola]|uniref:SpvB/TcaC N-terminal domain-containing protein n=1 Tax=Haloferula sargassicola TaxID=490096 RepID=UPI0033659398
MEAREIISKEVDIGEVNSIDDGRMKTFVRAGGFVLGLLAMFANQVLAYLPPIDFESPNFVPLQLVDGRSAPAGDPLQGWNLISGNATISPGGEGVAGGQALQLSQNSSLEETHLRRLIDWDPGEEIAFVDFSIRPPANSWGSMASIHVNGSQIAFQRGDSDTQGEIWVYHGNDDASDPDEMEQWLVAGPEFGVNPTTRLSTSYLRITLRQDTGRKVWDLFVDGKLVAVNLGFDGRGPVLQALDFFGSDASKVLIDNLSADPSNMLFADADKDGLPDAWEVAHGSDPNLYDRDALNPASGKSWLDEYLESLWESGTEGLVAKGGVTHPPIGVVPPLTILGAHQPVGALKGSLSVAGDGSAAYSIPIDLPKGTGGMEPKLSLDYSSNGTNGIAGLGWSLTGLQQITRGGASYAKDGVVDPVDFDANDRFFFNGERLVLVAGTYGADGSQYRTEMDSFARITAHG